MLSEDDFADLGALAGEASRLVARECPAGLSVDEVVRLCFEHEVDCCSALNNALKDGVDGVHDGRSALVYAAMGGDEAVVLALLRLKADPNLAMEGTGETALHAAVARGNCAAVKWLVAGPRADLTIECGGKTAIAAAADAGDFGVLCAIRLAVEAGGASAVDARVPDAAQRALLWSPQMDFAQAALALDHARARQLYDAAPAGSVAVNTGGGPTVFGAVFDSILGPQHEHASDDDDDDDDDEDEAAAKAAARTAKDSALTAGIATLRMLAALGADMTSACRGTYAGGRKKAPPLLDARGWRNTRLALALVEAGADLTEDYYGRRALHVHRDPAVVRAMLARGAEIAQATKDAKDE